MYKGKKESHVLDTSYITESVNDKLFNLEGLSLITPNEISRGISKLGDVSRMARGNNLIVISEVVEEVKIGLEQLNGHRHYIEETIKQMSKSRAQREEAAKLSREGILEDLKAYSNALFNFARTISGRDIRYRFSEKQLRYYENIFEITIKSSSDLDEIYSRRKLEEKSPLNIRAKLKTHKKIVATAYTLARNPLTSIVYILTTDGKLEELIRRVGRKVKTNNESKIVSINPIYKEWLVLFPLNEPLPTDPESEFVLEVLE